MSKISKHKIQSANSKKGGNRMTIQQKAMRMLEGLKGAGISYQKFSETTGMNLDQIYARTSKNSKLTDQRAAYYLGAA